MVVSIHSWANLIVKETALLGVRAGCGIAEWMQRRGRGEMRGTPAKQTEKNVPKIFDSPGCTQYTALSMHQ